MTNILIVDDSPSDRRFATSITQDEPGYHIVWAENGVQALHALETADYDAVLTDLNMPRMDGLTLVKEIRSRYPDLPTVVMTAHGSEATAMRALQYGAYSYVPKALLKDELVRTIRSVLQVRSVKDRRTTCGLKVVNQSVTLSLTNDHDQVTEVIDYIQGQMTSAGCSSGSEMVHVRVALEEALTNAIVHGNLEVSSKLREVPQKFTDTIEQRRTRLPFSERQVTIRATVCADTARFTISDEGPGFDVASIPDPSAPENLLKQSGRGVAMMHAMMDKVKFNGKGNEVILVKRFRAQPSILSAVENPESIELSPSPCSC